MPFRRRVKSGDSNGRSRPAATGGRVEKLDSSFGRSGGMLKDSLQLQV